MADVQTVIIEFQTDTTQVDTAINKLEKTGAIDSKLANGFKQTTAEISKQAAELQKTAAATTPLKKSLEDINKATKGFSGKFIADFQKQFLAAGGTIEDFKGGIQDALDEAGVSMEEFTAAIEARNSTVEKSSVSVKQRLAEVTKQLQLLKVQGEDNTEQYKQLTAEAGNLRDAIGDVGQEIKNSAANSKALDGIIGATQGVAAGFAIAEGAAGLFGSESKELNAVMVRVTSTMAILQGVQQIGNLLQKESAAVQLITNARLAIENGLQSQSVIVRFAAAAAQKVLNAAMAANPIGILVVAVAGLITVLATYGRSAAAARQQTSNLNVALNSGVKAFEEQSESIKRTGENAVNELENQGAAESKIAARRLETEKQLVDKQKKLIEDLTESKANNQEADLEKRKEIDDKIRSLQDKQEADEARVRDLVVKQQKILNEERLKNVIAGLEAELSAAEEGSKNQLNIQKRLIAARTALELNADGLLENERIAITAKSNEDRLEAEAAFNKRSIDLQLKGVESQLINVREGSQEELDLRKKALKLQIDSELTNTKLSENEKQAIIEQGLQNRLKLEREFNERITKEAIEDQISRNEAVISQIKTNDDDRLILQIANIELAAAAEVNAAKGNSSKIKEINAKRDADILAVRKKFIDDAAQYEIDIRTADNGPTTRALQKIVADERKGLEARKSAIKQLADFQIENINTKLIALENQKKFLSDKEYVLRYKQLQDQKNAVTEESEKATTELIKAENIKRAQIAIQVLGQVADVLQSINDTQTQKENDRLEAEKQRTAELLEAGAITEKEAAARNKRTEAEEKKARIAQAKREKDVAIFRALLAIPQAVLQGLAQGGPILAAIYGGLATAQAIIIASRPLPRFGHGKKSGYEGPAEIGETGAELYEQNGRMYLADKKQIVWLGAKDKVYNPTETKEMLMPVVDKQLMQWQAPAAKAESIDYDRLGKAVGKHINIPGFEIDEHGFKIWQQQGNDRKNYMDKRYSSK